MYIARYLKAFALTGRQVCAHKHPGRCPGLGASALSGRVGLTCETSVGNTMMDMCCGDEVKGEGYILNLILYSFFRIFGKTGKSEK